MSKPIIEIQNVGKRYRIGAAKEPYLSLREELAKCFSPAARRARAAAQELWALRDIDLTVAPGETVGIIGRNGAGKSTLLKILSRITPPTAGKITMRGRVGSLLEVGTGFHPELTGRENIYMNGAILGMSRREIARKFDEIVAFAEIEKFLDTPVKRYSSGMYVRLAFAVAAHLEPEILLIDEVLAVGDAQFQKKCLGKMDEVAQQGRTVLFVSHNMAAVKVLCKKGIVLEAGATSCLGTIKDCIEAYLGQQRSGGSIASHIALQHSHVQIQSIRVNNREADVVELPPESETLTVEVVGTIQKPMVVELELRMADVQGVPLALFSPGHEAGFPRPKPAGPFRIKHDIRMPRLTQGLYVLNLGLTDPGKMAWVDIPNAAVLHASGVATKSGLVIDYRGGAGFVFLESAHDGSRR